MTAKEQTIRDYVAGLNSFNLDQCLNTFVEGGSVDSPFYGKIPAQQFFTDLFSDSEPSDIQVRHIMFSAQEETIASAVLDYSWVLKDHTTTDFKMVVIFEFHETSDLLEKVELIYDTSKVATNF